MIIFFFLSIHVAKRVFFLERFTEDLSEWRGLTQSVKILKTYKGYSQKDRNKSPHKKRNEITVILGIPISVLLRVFFVLFFRHYCSFYRVQLYVKKNDTGIFQTENRF